MNLIEVFERFITILNVFLDIMHVLFFQVLSIFEKLHSKFESFFIEELKIPEQHPNKVYAPIFFLITLSTIPGGL